MKVSNCHFHFTEVDMLTNVATRAMVGISGHRQQV